MSDLIEKFGRTVRKALKPKLDLAKGTRTASFLFIFLALLIATGALFAANTYYNLDTNEVVTNEVQRVSKLTRATGGLIAGGGATDTLNDGVQLQVSGGDLRVGSGSFLVDESTGNTDVAGTLGVTGTSTFTATATFESDLVWSDGSNLAGFNNDQGGSQVYSLPGGSGESGEILATDQSGNLYWTTASSSLSTSTVEGDISAVGDVAEGAAFTSGSSGTSLWFHNSGNTGNLTIGDLSGGNATYTLPGLTGNIAITDGTLSGDGLLVTNNNGLVQQDSNLTWTGSKLGVGTSSPQKALDVNGGIRTGASGSIGALTISNGSGQEVILQATSSMSTSTTEYSLPSGYGSNDQVLTTDSNGNWSWDSVSGVGGLSADSPTPDRLARFKDESTLENASILDLATSKQLTIGDASSTFANTLNVEGNLDVANTITAATYTAASGDTIIGAPNNIVLDPDTGVVKIASGDHIETANGYKIGDSGNQRLIGMEPILGRGMPVRCSSACATTTATITRAVTDYPFNDTTGADLVHRLVVNYSDTIGSGSSTWEFKASDTGTYDFTFTVPGTGTTSTSTLVDHEQTYITPDIHDLGGWAAGNFDANTDDWYLEVKTDSSGATTTIQVNDIFLAAYEQIE